MELPGEVKVKNAIKGLRLRERYLGILMLALVVLISVGLFLLRQEVVNLKNYGYLGSFLISLISSATIILPVPGVVLVIALAAVLNPLWIGVTAGAGAALGEMTGYLAGYSGRAVIQKRQTYQRIEGWIKTHGWMPVSAVIFVLAFVPNPFFDLAGIAAGALRFPVWKFLLFCLLGKVARHILIAYGSAWGLSWFIG